jgi:hypothetical protein
VVAPKITIAVPILKTGNAKAQQITTKMSVHIKFCFGLSLYPSIASILSFDGKMQNGEANATTIVIPYRQTKIAAGVDPS